MKEKLGITFHYVNDKYDDGKIIAQYKLDIDENDTLDTLSKKNIHWRWKSILRL